jgi:cytochrome P450
MSVLNIATVQSLRSLQQAESTQSMRDLCETPEQFDQHMRRYATSVILSSVFGKRGARFEDPDVRAIYHVRDQFSEILEPGNTPPADFFPILKYLPQFLATWKQRAAAVRQGQQNLYLGLLSGTKARISRGIPVNCFMDRLLTEAETSKHGLDDEHLAYVGGVMMEAGSDSTSSTLLSFILAMMKYSEVQKKAQKEVDAVCGTSRSPTFEDLENLPYIRACVSEVTMITTCMTIRLWLSISQTLRWRPAVPAAFPHVLIQGKETPRE